jgi:hypothetical protein
MALKNKQLILVGVETVYNSGSALTTANAVQTGDVNITPLAGDSVQRNIIKPFFGNNQSIMVTQYATIDFEVELAGSGTAGTAPQFDSLLVACGFFGATVSSTYLYIPHTLSKVDESLTSATIYFQRDGIKHVLTGARGTVSFDMTVKTLPKMKFTMTGLLGAITDTPLDSTGVSFTHKAPVAISSHNTSILLTHNTVGFVPIMESFTLDMANDVKYRALVGSESVVISDRKPKGNIKIEAPALTTGVAGKFRDFFDIAKKSTLGTLSITHGLDTGNIIKIESATSGLGIEAPKYGDNDGVVMLDMGLTFIPTPAGNDEIKLIFS